MLNQQLNNLSFHIQFHPVKMKTSLVIFILASLSKTSNLATLHCVYEMNWASWDDKKVFEKYNCFATVEYQGEKNYITAVSQNHKGNRSPNDVKMLTYRKDQTIPQLLKFTDNFYPELESFVATNIGLEVITAEDFINFPKTLRIIYLYKNKLKEIPSNLFKYTPNLDTIALDRNEIEHVGNYFFQYLNLTKLKRFGINANTCTNFQYINSGEKDLFEKLRVELLEKCKATRKMIMQEEAEVAATAILKKRKKELRTFELKRAKNGSQRN